ncbi:protein of unknown function [Kyrpidia spormannii]|uniref:Uncharacterized protein n=1 Tax=Kyrpidia spormannii TaxID=2055160 RepID=A0ACA8Z5Q7_9BACL|nr:protein of unknown function [Kyrpidia spormannii]
MSSPPKVRSISLDFFTRRFVPENCKNMFLRQQNESLNFFARKLVQQRQSPSGVGLYFFLGHSTVVFAVALATAFAANWLQEKHPAFKDVGGMISTLVSGIFLVVIALLNLMICGDTAGDPLPWDEPGGWKTINTFVHQRLNRDLLRPLKSEIMDVVRRYHVADIRVFCSVAPGEAVEM